MSSKLLKVLTIVGTRPDTIKLAPVLIEFKTRGNLESLLCSSGQHLEMLNQALGTFALEPDIELNVMSPNQTLQTLTSKLVASISDTLTTVKPDVVLVHGDTTTAFCAALSSFYNHIPVVHIEAGLRTHEITEPFPEEFNRQAISRIADLNFAPTHYSAQNLRDEGIPNDRIIVSGNTIIDSLDFIVKKIEKNDNLQLELFRYFNNILSFDYRKSRFVLITMHRRENIGQGIENVCIALSELAKTFPSVNFIFPVHLNPLVSEHVQRILIGHENIFLIEPLPYTYFVALLSNSMFVITDSGGIQEESVSLGKKALVTRNKTERGEGISSGLLQIVATDHGNIIAAASQLILNPENDKVPEVNPYGAGNISKAIVDGIVRRYAN